MSEMVLFICLAKEGACSRLLPLDPRLALPLVLQWELELQRQATTSILFHGFRISGLPGKCFYLLSHHPDQHTSHPKGFQCPYSVLARAQALMHTAIQIVRDPGSSLNHRPRRHTQCHCGCSQEHLAHLNVSTAWEYRGC